MSFSPLTKMRTSSSVLESLFVCPHRIVTAVSQAAKKDARRLRPGLTIPAFYRISILQMSGTQVTTSDPCRNNPVIQESACGGVSTGSEDRNGADDSAASNPD